MSPTQVVFILVLSFLYFAKNLSLNSREATPGVIIEEKQDFKYELRVVTIFGKVICGGTDSRDFIFPKSENFELISKTLWDKIITYAELMAQGTDYLRKLLPKKILIEKKSPNKDLRKC